MIEEDKNVVTIVREFDAPRELVWKMWTTPDGYKKWWGPKGFTGSVVELDFRVGGRNINCMEALVDMGTIKKGQKMYGTGVYKEIIPLEKIVVTDSFSDEKGNVVDAASEYGMQGFPREMLVTVTFEDIGGKTKMTLRHSGVKDISDQDRTNMEQGWNESFDKLADALR